MAPIENPTGDELGPDNSDVPVNENEPKDAGHDDDDS